MKKGLIMFGFFASLTRALFSPINCTADYGANILHATATFVNCFVGNLTGNVDQTIQTTPDVV